MNENLEMKVIDTEDKKHNLSITFDNYQEKVILECIKRLKNPFGNIGVHQVARDLQIGENMAYEIFKREDFPSINIREKMENIFNCILTMEDAKKNLKEILNYG